MIVRRSCCNITLTVCTQTWHNEHNLALCSRVSAIQTRFKSSGCTWQNLHAVGLTHEVRRSKWSWRCRFLRLLGWNRSAWGTNSQATWSVWAWQHGQEAPEVSHDTMKSSVSSRCLAGWAPSCYKADRKQVNPSMRVHLSCFGLLPTASSRRPVKRYNLLVPDIFPRTEPPFQDKVDSSIDRKIKKLADYLDKNPHRGPKV